METRTLGTQGLEVSALGLGGMGMSEFYGRTDESEAIATVRRALELGVTFLDTADMYGWGANERLVGKAIEGRREDVVLATKFTVPSSVRLLMTISIKSPSRSFPIGPPASASGDTWPIQAPVDTPLKRASVTIATCFPNSRYLSAEVS